ncbi:putative exonuclease [Listeria phage LP-125]|uniref:Recombination related exonuclease n=4 Tax=Pecentumvirus TaxID=1857844 RepID=A0A7G9A556_9CAUD|nr:putative exonuclease [Listeria phage LP-125]AGI11449.1 putative exonuclease [Listeria phage LP-125]QNL31879.1 recombination related exonuclease [Listeria phage LP-Mix_6.1]QNL32077.1 recombination related exonuclease [Listeria phage LP-Mix_6.2]
MFTFKKVKIKNFLSIKDMELNLDKQGLVLIEGKNKTNEAFKSNGAGKTSMIDAITYAIFGKTVGGLKSDSVVNNKEKKNTAVILDFEVDKNKYRIERYRKDKKEGNIVKLYQGKNNITKSTVDNTDKEILSLFGIDFNTYVNAIMYGQGDMPIFSQATDKGKKEILERITSIDIYQKAQEIAKEKVKEKQAEQQEIENELVKYDYELVAIDNLEEQEIENYKAVQQTIEGIQATLSVASTELENFMTEAYPKKAELENSIAQFIAPQVDNTKVNELRADLTEAERKLLQINSIKEGFDRDLRKLAKDYENLSSSKICPTCGTDLGVDSEAHIAETKADIEKQMSVLGAKTHKILVALPSVNTAIESKKELVQQEIAKNEEIQRNYNQLVSTVRGYEQEVQQLENTKNSLEEKVASQQTYLSQVQSMPKPKSRDKDREEVHKKIEATKLQVLDKQKETEKYEEAVKAFSNAGIRSMVLDLVTPFLNEKANKYLTVLSGSDIEINFTTQVKNSKGELKDKFDVEIINGSGGSNYKANSAGEKKRIDLAISFAIQDLVMSKAELSTNIALYDECFDGLDSIGCENVITLLKERLETVSSIFVITHNENLKPLFEKVITVQKEDGVTTLIN